MSSSEPITYTSSPPPLTVEVSHVLLNSFLLGVITTFISYQVAGAVFDGFLGFKPRRKTTFSQVQTLLLVRQGSPLAILTNIFKTNWLSRLYYFDSAPEELRWGRRSVTRMLTLLLAAPVINILAIILVLESSSTLSFEDAGFPKLGYGLNLDLAVVETKPETSICRQAIVEYKSGDNSLADLTQCFPAKFVNRRLDPKGRTQLGSHSDTEVKVIVQLGTVSVEVRTVGYLRSDTENFTVKTFFDDRAVERWANRSLELLLPHCPDALEGGVQYEAKRTPAVDTKFHGGIQVDCDVTGKTKEAEAIAVELAKYMTFIERDELLVTKIDKETGIVDPDLYSDGSHLKFVTRRRRYMGLLVLCIFAAGALILRATTSLVLNNDVDEGIELAVKGSVGVGCCESLLRASGEMAWENGRVVRQQRIPPETGQGDQENTSDSEEGSQWRSEKQ